MTKSPEVDSFIASKADWQKKNLENFRKLIHSVEPDIEEGVKWGVPVFLKNKKLVCAMSDFKEHTKFNFFEGASLKDKNKQFNSGLDSKKHRSINLTEGDAINEENLIDLIKQAILFNSK